MAQCPTCGGTGTVRSGTFNPVVVPCPNSRCRAGVIYNEPRGGGGTGAVVANLIVWLVVIGILALIYFFS